MTIFIPHQNCYSLRPRHFQIHFGPMLVTGQAASRGWAERAVGRDEAATPQCSALEDGGSTTTGSQSDGRVGFVSWFCLRPENRPSAFELFCVVICWGGWGGWGVITSCVYVIIDFLRWTHFMLRCTLLLYFGEHTSYYVAHITLIRWTHFMLRCTRMF